MPEAHKSKGELAQVQNRVQAPAISGSAPGSLASLVINLLNPCAPFMCVSWVKGVLDHDLIFPSSHLL